MKTIRYILLTMAAAAFVTACSEELNPNDINKANPGDEVQFGLSLPGKTKTVYGEETSTGFPIYWVNGDKVKVASPQCQSGRNNAEYSVSVESATQNYATSLTKTGDAGVQWGDTDEAVFYSIYPSTDGTSLNISGETVTATLHVDATQFASTSDKKDSESGKAYIYAQPAEMGNVVMYAKTADVSKGSTVELHYTPFSTVLEFELTAPEESDASHQSEITIQSLTLTAPAGTTIAGDFSFNFPTADSAAPSVEAATGGDNAITLHFLDNNQYTTVLSTTDTENGKQRLKAKMCVMPISNVENLDGWTVEVNTSAGTFKKNLTSATGELKPGLVHKIKLPALNYSSKEWTYDPANWIPSLPDYTNIYLSEISLPGAWYAGAPLKTSSSQLAQNYQATESISELWSKGIRAFAIECRSWTTRGGVFVDISNRAPTRVCVSGTGTEEDGAYSNNFTGVTAKNISEIIFELATCISSNADEYGVLVLSYADGGSGGHRALDYAYFIQGVANEITESGATNIYSGGITPKTTVEQVKGQLIVVVNVDDNITKGSYGDNGNILLNYTPFPTNVPSVSDVYFSNLHWNLWDDTYKAYATMNTSDLLWCFSSANRTDCTDIESESAEVTNANGVATLSQRKTALKSMGDHSKTIYGESSHNVWFYFNCGGGHATATTGDTDAAQFAQAMNPWLLNRIRVKSGEAKNSEGEYIYDPSPLGIVMFNRCTDTDTASYKGPAIIDAIIRMNSKFYLKHAGTSGSGTGGTTENTIAEGQSSYKAGGEIF